MRYSVQFRDRIFIKGCGILSFVKNMGKNVGKNISKNLSCKYIPKILDHATNSATEAFQTAPKRAIQKTAAASGDLTSNKYLQQNNS